MNQTARRWLSRPSSAGVVAVLDVAIVVVYLYAINSQSGPRNDPRVIFVAAYIMLLAMLSATGALTLDRYPGLSSSLLLASGCGHISLGVLAIFSVGWPLIIAGAILVRLALMYREGAVGLIFAPVIIIALLVLGVVVTS